MKILLTGIAFLFCLIGVSQTSFDARLLEKFSEARIAELQKDHPEVIEYWTFYLDNSYEIMDVVPEKVSGNLPELKIKDVSNFNILEMDIHMDRHSNKYFTIKGHPNKVLMLLSNSEFAQNFNEYRQNN